MAKEALLYAYISTKMAKEALLYAYISTKMTKEVLSRPSPALKWRKKCCRSLRQG